ncbi:CoA transferase [Streptomyces sp. SP17BM10]|uniref:CoA transferase n=1 Tax=Streptomyces sp. SP17BM10 TaxID=3002530 RepID=UPI002E79D2FC|nr:CoA transferase [Streptomyces sp. SP17BM10]MEE1787603.1 CoA transferase [Streptomyces sp. SP17BM10]
MTERPMPPAQQFTAVQPSHGSTTAGPTPLGQNPTAHAPVDADGPTAHAWAALGGPADLLDRVTFHGPDTVLPSGLPVRRLARATVAACSLAAAELAAHRAGGPVPAVRIDQGAVATAFVSERHLTVDGRAPVSFAPHSGFWRTADGWIRTHANYPHHRTRLLSALGLPADAGPQQLAAVLSEQPAEAVQERAYEAGALAVAVAPVSNTTHPLIETRVVGTNGPNPAAPRSLGPAPLPAAGIRVLDLTRVIAGPVATRTLALLGADVLRIDSPHLPEADDAHADTGFGKRSARLDLADPADHATFEELLATADAVITGYRPGALDAHGLAPDALLDRHPGLIVAQLCAWGWTGPWAGRRGFDSLVQAGVGIAAHEAAPEAAHEAAPETAPEAAPGTAKGGHPGVLPAQALDHGTGYLIAAAVLRSLTEQRTGRPGGRHLRFSLAGTASWLLHDIARAEDHTGPAGSPSAATYDPARYLAATDSAYGRLRHALPPIAYDGAPTNWSRPPGRWGTDRPTWL